MVEPFSIAEIALESGGKIGICPLPGRSGKLSADLDALYAWQPAIVVSMTEQTEMDAAGCDELGAVLRKASIEWMHLPVRDFGVLDGASLAAWPSLSMRLHDVLDRGRNALIHCHGGRGRSGMVALRLMTERGVDAQAALAQLRTVRPGAVETEDQLAWANEPRRGD